MKFTKMHGIGNDYIYVDCVTQPLEATVSLPPARLAELLSDRHFGVGSDGLILIRPSECADFCMEMYNADGSRGAMCGNGIRCVAKYVYDRGLTNMTTLSIETLAGIKTVELTVQNNKVTMVKVAMGIPMLTSASQNIPLNHTLAETTPVWETLATPAGEYETIGISMGNPHTILFVDDTAKAPVETLGPMVESHPCFPDRTNVEFVRVHSRSQLEMRVWERGSGETLACGTGACASVVAAVLAGYCDRTVNVRLLGGSLKIHWNPETGQVEMSGPAAEVFTGEIEL
ncbi:MAG: diaminopimelate epimerase [Lachnospiraceae bacterium]|jgi:diaminopimelate epimerase|nr:diaminopimelate epimerase [Lachnospiraceae bacterium]